MPFAQTNYQQKLGNSNLTIAEAGCFVTADCNLLEDIGVEVDPATLNNFYRDHNLFTYDLTDRANDDITWSTVTSYDNRVTLKQHSSGGWPDSNFAIVKFYYKSHSGYMTTHFCRVHDWTNKQVIDSWNGQVITVGAGTYYGEPVEWATYTFTPPEPPPAPKAQYVYERLSTPMNVRVKPGCSLWNLDFTGGYANAQSLGQLSTDPNNPTEFVAVGKATRQDMNDHPTYFMSNESFGSADTTGTPTYNQGVNTVDLEPAPVASSTPAPAIEASAPVLPDDHIEVHVLPPNPEAWKTSFKTNESSDYTATASTIIHDLDGKVEDMQLVKQQTVHVAGTFTGPDGIKYYRTVNATNGYTDAQGVKHEPSWRGIPIESLIEDDAIYTFKDDLIDDFKELKGYVSTREKAIITAAKIHANANWLASRLKKRN